VADKGYHSRDGLKELEDGAWRSRIAEKRVAGINRWCKRRSYPPRMCRMKTPQP
jgi:hypothetical protein